jgi:hypothetical protein
MSNEEEKLIEELYREKGKVKFETRIFKHANGNLERKIFIDGIMLDYSVDLSSYVEAVQMGPAYEQAIKADIVKHFTNCVSDMVGRKVTYEEVFQATKTGWI